MKGMKGAILAAGYGKRLGRVSRAVPKPLIPVAGRPLVEYTLEMFREAGVKDIYVVVGWKKEVIIGYLEDGGEFGVHLSYVIQREPRGTADAILQLEGFLDEAFVAAFGDIVLKPKTFLKEAIDYYRERGASALVAVTPVNDVKHYGVIKAAEDGRVLDLVEKPSLMEAPSNLAIIGLYIFEPIIFEAIKKTPLSPRREVELTDSIRVLRSMGHDVYYKVLKGLYMDIGVYDKLVEANKLLMKEGKP